MPKFNSIPLAIALFGGGIALSSCEKLPQASIAPKATLAPASKAVETPTYTPAQQAWLNFVAKVRRGEQLDPTGQYVKDGTMLPADGTATKRPKLSVGRDKFPFMLNPDGTIVLVPKSTAKAHGGYTTNQTDPIDNPPQECPFGGCPSYPVITSQFFQSTGIGGGNPILDIKVAFDKPTYPGYNVINGNLNSGAGGREIYYQFTRDPASVQKGVEYYKGGYSDNSYVVRYYTDKGSTFSSPTPQPYFWPIWYAVGYYYQWNEVDLNAGAGGEYIYSYNSKDVAVLNPDRTTSYYNGFSEIGVLIGNSDQIQPPSGWTKYPNDLNEGAGGNHIYFCHLP